MKMSLEIGTMDKTALKFYAQVCGRVLARAHARSVNPAVIAGWGRVPELRPQPNFRASQRQE
jgi:hypothetical protein